MSQWQRSSAECQSKPCALREVIARGRKGGLVLDWKSAGHLLDYSKFKYHHPLVSITGLLGAGQVTLADDTDISGRQQACRTSESSCKPEAVYSVPHPVTTPFLTPPAQRQTCPPRIWPKLYSHYRQLCLVLSPEGPGEEGSAPTFHTQGKYD